MKPDQPLLVEFVGLPASGKTTVALAVKDRLENLERDGEINQTLKISTSTTKRASLSRVSISRMIVSNIVRSPIHAGKILYHLHRSRQRSIRHILRYIIFQMFLESELRGVSTREIHLSDQGFLQHLWRVRLTAETNSIDSVKKLANIQYPHFLPALIVFVDVDHHIRFARGDERGTSMNSEFIDPTHPEIVKDIAAYDDIKSLVVELSGGSNDDFLSHRIENLETNLSDNVSKITQLILDRQRSLSYQR